MAKQTQVILIDDLDGQTIDGDGKTVTFAHGGNSYEIDLTEANARKLQEALAPYIAVARRVGAKRGAAVPEKPDLPAIRAWAKQHGVKVSERGRVSQQVQEAYRAAH
jgi:hypothetical protein